jgi:predicted DNA-binding transcriptional regulator YafY
VLKLNEVEFDYRKPGSAAPERRRVRPYHLANRENLWYLIAHDLERNALRTYALPRLTNVTVTKQHFEKPDDFTPEKFFAKSLGVLSGDGNFQVVIRFKPEAADLVREREWHESQEMRELRGGGLELTLRLGALAEIERWVLGWGSSAEVLKPAALRDKVKSTAAAMSALYG